MKHPTLAGAVAACLCFGLATPLLAAQPATPDPVSHPASGDVTAGAMPAETCLTDLRAFDSQMEKDGYWLGGSGYGYGYPVGGYPVATATGYRNARPGYEVRVLVASANILARHGQQQPCEEVLSTTRDVYKQYVADLHSSGAPMVDVPGWRQQLITQAQPITSQSTSFRADELVGTDVRNLQNEALGSVDDLVMNPQTGKIAYLVLARGGIFGIGEKYVAVPWEDFKITPTANLLVLDSSKAAMAAAPQVDHDQFATPSHFDQQSQKVDAYWKTHLSIKDATGSNG